MSARANLQPTRFFNVRAASPRPATFAERELASLSRSAGEGTWLQCNLGRYDLVPAHGGVDTLNFTVPSII
jgi:hypothetical protein